jgi:hypothetical protein
MSDSEIEKLLRGSPVATSAAGTQPKSDKPVQGGWLQEIGDGKPFKMYEIELPKPAPKLVDASEEAKQTAFAL